MYTKLQNQVKHSMQYFIKIMEHAVNEYKNILAYIHRPQIRQIFLPLEVLNCIIKGNPVLTFNFVCKVAEVKRRKTSMSPLVTVTTRRTFPLKINIKSLPLGSISSTYYQTRRQQNKVSCVVAGRVHFLIQGVQVTLTGVQAQNYLH